jgi:hypothetical protein
MKLTTLLKLQVLYVILGIGYNCLSLYFTATGKPALAPTQPVLGLVSMVVYALFLIPGYMRKLLLYRILMGVAILVMGYGGVVTHIINIFTQPQLYSSIVAWAGAVGINIFGLVLNIIAVLGKYKQ